jgi:DNA-binding SARP family transcriptional activator
VGNEGGVPLQFRILGPLEVVRGEECLAFRGRRERAVLALLVVNANRTVSAERLAEDLWSGDPPDGAIHSLRVYVSRLRQALGPAASAVVTRPSGYALQVDASVVDALRFDELVARARDEAKGGDHTGAAATLREALALWRGPALADVADAPSARVQAGRLEEARLCALEDRIEADLACGRHGEVTAELEALTGEHPFRERLWSQRIVALYRCGRQADALRAYQELRLTLREQLGIEPSVALRQLEGAVLRHGPELDGHPGGATAEPGRLPRPLRREERLPLVGREVELSQLDQIWQAARSGQRHLLLLAGEPGIGKSRLAAEFARIAHREGAMVLFGRCDEGMGVPYQPFVEAVGRYVRQAAAPVLGRLAGELVRLVPEIGERVQGLSPPVRSDPETERYRLFNAVAAWLGAVSESVPVTFVIEDLHWATKPTLLLLSHLLRSDEDLRLLLVVTFRDTPLDMTPDLIDLVAELLRLPDVERVRLVGLSEAGVGALMEAQADQTLDDEGWDLARAVHHGTAGNPFYVREMLRHLAEQGNIVRRNGRWVAGQPIHELVVPDRVRDVVERRLTRLPDRTSEILALSAVLGERFDLAVVVEASGESELSVVGSLGAALSARLVEETDTGRYHFTHALVRSALENALGTTRRLHLHRAAGLAVEAVHAGRLDAHLPQLAYHFAQAREVHKGIDYASRAGDRALTQLAPDEAMAYYRQALELLDAAEPAEAQRLRLLIALGEAQRQAGDPAFRETLLTATRLASEQGDADALARAALANTRGFVPSAVGEVDGDRVASLQAALDATGGDDAPRRARLLAALGLELIYAGDQEGRVRLADEALAIARRAGDDSTLAHVLLQNYTNYFTIWTPGTLEKRLAYSEELVPLAERVGDPVIVAWASLVRFRALIESGNVEAADPHLDQAERLTGELGQPTLRFLVGWFRTARTILAGDLEEGERRALTGFELGQATGQRDPRSFLAIQLFILRFDQGRLGELEEHLAERVAATPGVPALRACLALALCELGRPDEATEHYELLAVESFTAMPVKSSWILAMAACAGVCAAMGDRARAPVLFHLLEPYAGQLVFTPAGALGAVAHHLAILARTFGDFDEAERRFADAAAIHERIGAPTWLARTRLEWARMLISRAQPGDSERARGFLGQAMQTARELGLANVERMVVQLLKRSE